MDCHNIRLLIHLHLRADDLTEPRPITFVWIHGDDRRETMGFLQPSETISLAASLPLARLATPVPALAEQPFIPVAGAWKVEVYSAETLVFERDRSSPVSAATDVAFICSAELVAAA